MLNQLARGAARKTWQRRALASLLAVVLVVGLVPPALAGKDVDVDKIDADLYAAVQKDRKATYSVIVTADGGKSPQERKANRGAVGKKAVEADEDGKTGKASGDLGLINGVAVQMSGKQILKLAKDNKTKKIALDRIAWVQQLGGTGTVGTTTNDALELIANLKSMQTLTAQAPTVWTTHGNQGQGVTVAVLDSGIQPSADLPHAVFGVDVATNTTALGDPGGHGTHVAGIIAGNGTLSANNNGGSYRGMGPQVRVMSVKVTNDTGGASYSSIIKGLQWVVATRKVHNIRVVNMSLGASPLGSYKDDPLAAAVEMAWFSGVVVVVSAGNKGNDPGTITVPANDPYVIAVGAVESKNTATTTDDTVMSWSSRGPTKYDNLPKPDLVAVGRQVISLRVPGSYIDRNLAERTVATHYTRLSGTSMAAPVVAGAAALVLAANPALTPNQVKQVLKQTARPVNNSNVNARGAGEVDALGAVNLALTGPIASANANQRPSNIFAQAITPLMTGAPTVWRNGTYGGRTWTNGSWDNGSWDNVAWENLSWENISWENISWTNVSWESLTGWNNGSWDNGSWDNGAWDNGSWDNGSWDNGSWDNGQWDSALAED